MASQMDGRRMPAGALGNTALDAEDESGEHPVGLADGERHFSGAFPRGDAGEDERPFAALAPYYESRDEEHAELDIPDPVIGEQPALAGSSLVPPPAEAFPVGRVVIGVLVLGLAAVALVTLTPRAKSPAPVAVEVTPGVAVQAVVPVAAEPVPAAPVVEQVAVEAVVAEVAQAPAVEETSEQAAAREERRERRHARRAEAAAGKALAATDEAPALTPTAGAPAQPEPETPSIESLTLPTAPTRAQITAGFSAVLPELKRCADGATGGVTAKVTIAGSGQVRYAVVGGDFSGTPAGSCMARALRGASFPQFARTSVKVEYPFSL